MWCALLRECLCGAFELGQGGFVLRHFLSCAIIWGFVVGLEAEQEEVSDLMLTFICATPPLLPSLCSARQAKITTELIEIISGAESIKNAAVEQ